MHGTCRRPFWAESLLPSVRRPSHVAKTGVFSATFWTGPGLVGRMPRRDCGRTRRNHAGAVVVSVLPDGLGPLKMNCFVAADRTEVNEEAEKDKGHHGRDRRVGS